MTATRDRRSDPDEDAEPAWDERSILGKSRGLPWWGAVLLAFGLAAIAAAFDMQRQDSLGRVFQGAYFVGCVAAVCLVRRRSLFGPIVQPPLVFAITAVAAVVLLAPDTGGGTGLKWLLFSVALPLTSNFLTMAVTTAVTGAIGVFRLWRERDPDLGVRPSREQRRADQARGRPEPDEMDFDAFDDAGGRRRPEAHGGVDRRGADPAARGDRRSEPGRRGAVGRERDADGRRGVGGRRGEEPGRGRADRGRARPDVEPDRPDGRGGGLGRRPGRPEQSLGDDSRRGERSSSRTGRGRTRDADQPRRHDSEADPRRREDRVSRRDLGDRGVPAREPRRRDPYR